MVRRPSFRSVLLFVALLQAAACAQAEAVAPPALPREAPLPVRTAPVELGALPPIAVSGILAGKEEVKVSFKNGGTLASLRVEAGARVHKGQLLATLDRTEIQSQLAEAQASADKAQRDYQRALKLQQSGTVAQAGLDNARTSLDVAQAQLAIARYNDRVSVLSAPADGVIEHRLAEATELVGPGQPIYGLRTLKKGLVLRVGLTDRQVQEVALGSPGQVRFSALPGRVFAAAVSELASGASPHTGTFEAELQVSGEGSELLRPGLVGTVELQRPAARLPWIPVEALVEQSGLQASVYTLDPAGLAQKRAVAIAYLQGGRAAIGDGLEGVAAVVVDGAAGLEPGRPVQLAQ